MTRQLIFSLTGFLVLTALTFCGDSHKRTDNEIKALLDSSLAAYLANVDTSRQATIDCVRGRPEPVVKNNIFPKTTFTFLSDSSIAFEIIEFDNGDNLVITHSGCEYYVLTFRFVTARFQNDTTNSKYWFEKALQLINESAKGIDAPIRLDSAITALTAYSNKTDTPKFREEIDYGETEIRNFVSVDRVQKINDKRFSIELTFAIGPL